MCGIVGYIGEKKAASVIFEALKQLDYRGYDSAGIATVSEGKIHCKKDVGRLHAIHEKHNLTDLPGALGIGHTRWATHGVPNEPNAHPHSDCTRAVCLAHNGVIENYHVLKEELARHGHKYSSDTDSEVVAHVIEEELKTESDTERAFKKAIGKLQGSYAIVMLRAPDEKIYVARRGSPIVIGIGKGEMFCASDIPALLHHTREFLILEDNEFAFLTREGARIERDGKNIARKPMRINWTPEMARKEGYEYFTLKEIHEQPRTITDTLMDEKSIDEVAEFARRFLRIEVVACGTSYHAGMVFKHLIQKFARIPCETIIASEYKYAPVTDSKTLVLAISQSGETADTLAAVKEAKVRGARVLALVNVLGSSLTREADKVFYTHAGPEISVVSTKAFTSQLAALAHVAFELANRKEMIEHLRTIPNVVEEILKRENEIEELARKLKDKNDFFFIGRGISHPTAMEGALKLKEISYSHAEAYPGGELKHGPLSLLEKGVPVIAIAPNDETKSKMLGNIKECKARSALLIALSDSDEILEEADLKIRMPAGIAPELTPIVYIIPLQLLAYHIATMRGLDPDKPRNLAKSVTVE